MSLFLEVARDQLEHRALDQAPVLFRLGGDAERVCVMNRAPDEARDQVVGRHHPGAKLPGAGYSHEPGQGLRHRPACRQDRRSRQRGPGAPVLGDAVQTDPRDLGMLEVESDPMLEDAFQSAAHSPVASRESGELPIDHSHQLCLPLEE